MFVRTLAAVAILHFASASVAGQDAPAGPTRFAAEIKAFADWDAKNAVPQDAVLFVGSSTIRLWPTADRFPGVPVVNRGFGGSQIADVNHYLHETVLKYRPAVVVFYAGDNDINGGRTPQQVLDDFRAFVNRVIAARADTRIIYLPIKPSVARWSLWPTMKDANDRVASYIQGRAAERSGAPRMFYADVATPMLTPAGGTQSHLYVADGLHMSDAGYDIWTRVLTPVIAAAQKAR
jgi:lysophospholipase L1-like esterase